MRRQGIEGLQGRAGELIAGLEPRELEARDSILNVDSKSAATSRGGRELELRHASGPEYGLDGGAETG